MAWSCLVSSSLVWSGLIWSRRALIWSGLILSHCAFIWSVPAPPGLVSPRRMYIHGLEIVYLTVGAIAFALNIAETILILRMRKRWKPFDKLLLSLSFADLLVAISTVIFCILWLLDVSVKGHQFSNEYFLLVLMSSEDYSLLHILAITVDRFFAVKYPLRHSMRMQGRLPVAMIAAIWISVVSINVIIITVAIKAHEKVLLTIKVFSVSLILLGICYAIAYWHMFKQVLTQARRRSKSYESEKNYRCQIKELLFQEKCKNERTMLMTCCLVLSSYIICMYPISVEALIAKSSIEVISPVSQLLLLSNSVLNPLVYFFKGYRERRMRESRHQHLLRECCQEGKATAGTSPSCKHTSLQDAK